MKICTRCGIPKETSEFSPDNRRVNGLQSACKKCICEMVKKNHADNPEKVKKYNKQWRENNAEYNKERIRQWNADNKGRVEEYRKQYRPRRAEIGKEYYQANRDNILEYGKVWRGNNVEKTRAIGRKAMNKRLNTPKGKLNNAITCRMRESLKGSKANRKWEELVDFTIDQLKFHLEKKFTPEMNWDNYGIYWHIDHKVPIAIFNFQKPEDIEFRICWSLKNLQPLEKIENIRKGAKVDEKLYQELMIGVNGGK